MKTFRCFFVSILFTVPLAAADSAKVLAIKEVLAMTGAADVLETARRQNVAMVKQVLATQQPGEVRDEQHQKVVARIGEKYEAFSHEFMGWATWEPTYISLYDELFSEKEILGLRDFYLTETGKAMIRALPLLTTRMQEMMFRELASVETKVQSLLQEAVAEIEAEQAKVP